MTRTINIIRPKSVSHSTICVAVVVTQLLQVCRSHVWLFYALYHFVIHRCKICFDCFLDLACGCLCGANRAHSMRYFWIRSNYEFVRSWWVWLYILDLVYCLCEASVVYLVTFGFVWSFGFFVFFRFDLSFLRSERSPLRNFCLFKFWGLFIFFMDTVCCFMTFIRTNK